MEIPKFNFDPNKHRIQTYAERISEETNEGLKEMVRLQEEKEAEIKRKEDKQERTDKRNFIIGLIGAITGVIGLVVAIIALFKG